MPTLSGEVNVKEFLHIYDQHPVLGDFLDRFSRLESAKVKLAGLVGSSKSVVIAKAFQQYSKPILAICENEEQADFLQSDLRNLTGVNAIYHLPSSFKKPFKTEERISSATQDRTEILNRIKSTEKPFVLIATPTSLGERVISTENFEKSRTIIKKGEEVDLDFLMEVLNEFQFQREDFVYEPGQYSVRGGIVDVYSFSDDLPYRLELDGRYVESIRLFDPVTQLSVKELTFTQIVPDIQEDEIAGERVSVFEYLPESTVSFVFDLPYVEHFYSVLWSDNFDPNSEFDLVRFFETPDNLLGHLEDLPVAEFGNQTKYKPRYTFRFETRPQKLFDRNFNMLIGHLREEHGKQRANLIFSDSSKQIERLYAIFKDLDEPVSFEPVYQGLSSGFSDDAVGLHVYTEHQLFDRYYSARKKTRYSKSQALTIRELRDLRPGDFVTHIDHGIGVFQGLQKMEMGGKMQEAVRIQYKNNDLLYVNIGSLHKISKYTGKEGHQPRVNKLGSDAWKKLKSKTKKKVKDIARDLIKLYAQRKAESGTAFSPDNYLQVELEASFLYEDTPDQAKATEDVKKDMESPHPMDRLVCGDVGFGKTEIAIRAAFKAVCESKQVAVLVPTTILAQQHFHTFSDRLRDFPVTVDYVNRFRTKKQQTETLKNLKEGKVDILIGTHRILGKDVEFNDLGLMVIDEEQKFGVAAKEKLKKLRVNVDCLTLTATPIPRTLHFSLMGARDLSVINTPPPNRQPIITEVHPFSKEILKDAVDQELERGGQVFIVHNRVKDIRNLADMVQEVCPRARIIIGHGQMPGDELENVMVGFIEGDYDVLIATTIIESGLDIPNANTIIINNAHHFGLSDLHQMRGRVGRSNKKAYAILFAPPKYTLTDDAQRRLTAIEEYSDLGSGFNVAMRDLDIRGAGNLLGGEQSGFIAEIGFNMYHKILDEAVEELKNEEFQDLLTDQKPKDRDCSVETDEDIMIPHEYVPNVSERLNLYNQLARIKTPDELLNFRNELKDRFGNLPETVQQLLRTVLLKWKGMRIGFEKISLKNSWMRCTFPKEEDVEYYQSSTFEHIIKTVQTHPHLYRMTQKSNKLLLVVDDVNNLEEGIQTLDQLVKGLNTE